MDTSNNIAFRANIVTTMNGRHGIMQKVAEKFSERTSKLPGELHIFRNKSEYPDAIVVSLNKTKDYILHDYGDLLGNNLKSQNEVTSNLVNRITTTFINIYKAMVEDVKFEEFTDNIVEQLKNLKKTLRSNKMHYDKAIASGDTKFSQAFACLIEQNEMKIASLEKIYNQKTESYISKLEKMSQKEPKLEVWSKVIADDLKNI